jgi:DNA-directed RNA polymerase subunit RPC12/RpoP
MNFISRMGSADDGVELKYCERCGGLFLRPQASDGVHCGGCKARLAARPETPEAVKEPPSPRKSRNRGRTRAYQDQQEEAPGGAQIDSLQGVATLEVRA